MNKEVYARDKKKILVAVDGSEHSNLVITKAIEYARLLSGEIVLVYCQIKFPSVMAQLHRDKEISDIIKYAEQLVAPYLARLRESDIRVEERLMEEPAGTRISDVARIEKCDLIIMGSRGLTNLASLIVGSVTNRVLQTAPCSVLVVR